MVERIINSQSERDLLVNLIRDQKLPFSVTITRGRKRTIQQNKLQRLWCNEISEQLRDRTPEEVRGYCKLTIGVPILRAENEAFCAQYDQIIKPMPYEHKLAIMQEPIDFPVTRLMSKSQKTDYLDQIHRHFTSKGLSLTLPLDDNVLSPMKKREAEV